MTLYKNVMSKNRQTLYPTELTADTFGDYGDVIELDGHDPITINSGNCQRYSDLARLDISASGRPGISLFDAKPYDSPLLLTYVERHPLGSQAFLPTSSEPYLVVVAQDSDEGPQRPDVFVTRGYQGVNYYRNIWHGVLTPIKSRSLFVVVDYIGGGENLQEYVFDTPYSIDFSGC